MTTLRDLAGTEWAGKSELWLDPMGNDVSPGECRVRVTAETVEYTWTLDGKTHEGRLALRAGGADFTDTFHASKGMKCDASPGAPWALVDVRGTYGAGEGPPWGWRITLARRSFEHGMNGELVLQMTNIAPWGEEVRAARMICARA
jgi:hypothetical protein